MKSWYVTAALACAIAVGAPSAAAVRLVVKNGILQGASGVVIGGASYNVSLVDGTCASVFGMCSQQSFAFQTQTSARQAASAIINQLLVDGPAGNFDSNPRLLNGCTTTISNQCQLIIPYSTYNTTLFLGISTVNNAGNGSDFSFAGTYAKDSDFTQISNVAFARFIPSSAVPETSTWAMMIVGFGAVGAGMRRRQVRVSLG